MKLLLVLAVLLAGCDNPAGPATQALPESPTDLIPNGRFESTVAPWAGEFPVLETGPARYPVGRASLRTDYDGTRRSIRLSRNGGLLLIPVEPGDTLWLSFSIRASSGDVYPRVNVTQFSHPDTLLGSFSRGGANLTPDTWTTSFYRVILGPDVRHVSMILDVVGPGIGTAWFDEVHLWPERCGHVEPTMC